MCFVQGQGQKREQKHTTKNFVGFHNHSSINYVLNRLQQFTNNNVCKVVIKTTSGLSTVNDNETKNDIETEF